jgi:uncharacterized membrane protein (UPF0127 family)
MKLRVRYKEKILSENIALADTFGNRVIGLMFRESPKDSDGLLLEPCNSIHTFFMRYPLDVVFLNRGDVVVKVIRNLRPWRMTPIYFRARKTLELPAGKLPADVREGDQLEISHV